ncbi:MAG: geranylgeranyl reductase family protein [Rhodothermales bacterium]
MTYDYDAVVVGGGPSGSTTALYAARHGLRVLLVDRDRFPRDKICGDAISGKSMQYLDELGLLGVVERHPHTRIDAIVFSSPDGARVRVPMNPDGAGSNHFFVSRREVFDNILFSAARSAVETLEGFRVDDVVRGDGGRITGVTGRADDGKHHSISARYVVGADGFSSIVARKTGLYDPDPDHWIVATRAYYRGVPLQRNTIELHYVDRIQPGYFWIFPVDDDLVNVGVGILQSTLKKKGLSLRDVHGECVGLPAFGDRFGNAEPIGGVVGWNLPVGSKQRRMHGPGFLLVGDAAGLIDPFVGEGIGNAMCSGKITAEMLAEAASGSGVDVGESYRKRIWSTLGPELRLSYRLQRIARFKPLLNLVVDRATSSKEVARWLSGMLTGAVPLRRLLSPMTYARLLFK